MLDDKYINFLKKMKSAFDGVEDLSIFEEEYRKLINPSFLYMEEGRREGLKKLEKAKEYSRGYKDGKKAKKADEWQVNMDRRKVINNIKNMKTFYLDELANTLECENNYEAIFHRLLYLLGEKSEQSK